MIKLINLNPIITENKPGQLVNLNISEICKNNQLIFNPNHSFYINDLNSDQSRGNHSNSNASELLICLSGKFDIQVFNGIKYEKYIITTNNGIFIPKNIWIEFNNFENCIILAYVDIDITIEKKSIYNLEDYKKCI